MAGYKQTWERFTVLAILALVLLSWGLCELVAWLYRNITVTWG